MFYCPNCHRAVPNVDAQSCPHCGSDAETGWKPDAEYDSIELPEDDDYDLESTVYRHAGVDRTRLLAGPVLMLVVLVLLGVGGYQHYRLGVVLPAAFIVIMAYLGLRVLSRSSGP